MPVSHADGFVPDAALLNAIQGDAVEVYETASERDEQSFVHGDVVWVKDLGELQSWDGAQWIVQAALPEQRRVVSHPRSVPAGVSAVISADDVVAARRRGLETARGSASVVASSGNVATGGFGLDDFYAHVGAVSDDEKDAAYNSVDDIAEKFNYVVPNPTLNNPTTMVRFLELDFPYQTIVMLGVSSLVFHRDLRCEIVTIGSGGYGGAAGVFRLTGSTELSAVGGGGGGAGSFDSRIVDLRAGDLIQARCGGRIIYRDVAPVFVDQFLRDGHTLDSAGQASAVWRNGRPIGSAQGGSRGGSHADTLQGRDPLEAAYYVAGGSQGGVAGSSAHYTQFPAPPFLAAPNANRGGEVPHVFGDERFLASGSGGGGAGSEGRDGVQIDFTNRLGTFAEGGLGGDGVMFGGSGVPEICGGGKGGTAAGYVGVGGQTDDDQLWGRGGDGSSVAVEEGVPIHENAGVNLSRNKPGLGAVLIRFRVDGHDFGGVL